MAPGTSVCVTGVGETQKVYLSSPTKQSAVNYGNLLPAGSCPGDLHSLLMLEPYPEANILLQGSEVSGK